MSKQGLVRRVALASAAHLVRVALAMLAAGLGLSSQVLAANLIPNDSFEKGLQGWSGSGQTSTQLPHTGAACLQLVDRNPSATVSCGLSQTIPVKNAKLYRLSAWVRTDIEGRQVLISVGQYTSAGQWISGNNMDFPFQGSQQWVRFSVLISSFHPQAAGIRVSLLPTLYTIPGELQGVAWFDDVGFEEVLDTAATEGNWLIADTDMGVWLSPVEQKVRRDLSLPGTQSVTNGVWLSAARGEYEPFQLVLSPPAAQSDSLTNVLISDLMCGTNRLGPECFSVREVDYVFVTEPSTVSSKTGWSPDPLPALPLPLALPQGLQQPLWITFHAPSNAVPGVYQGTLRLSFGSASTKTIPLQFRIWNFALSSRRHLRTAYGMDVGMLDHYHQLGGNPSLRREVFRLYLNDFAEHRISPMDPIGDDWYRVDLADWQWSAGAAAIVVDSPGNPVLLVSDQKTNFNESANSGALIPINRSLSYFLSWRAKVDARTDGYEYLISVSQYDTDGTWISGANFDAVRTGTQSWRQESWTIGAFRTNTAFVRLALYARRWTDAGKLTGKAWFDDIVFRAVGGTENLAPNGGFDQSLTNGVVVGDFRRFDDAAAYAFDKLGMDGFSVMLPGFAGVSAQGSAYGSLFGQSWGTPEYDQLFTKTLQCITGHLAASNWLAQAYAYWADEPPPASYPLVQQGMDLIHRADPRLKRLLTESIVTNLYGRVDIWSPLLSNFNQARSTARQGLDEEVWWYVCTLPKAPYPNDFIDQSGVGTRIQFWLAWKYGVQGSLHWTTTYWAHPDPTQGGNVWQDPWQDPMSYFVENGQLGRWANGDGRLLYPPRPGQGSGPLITGPTPSIRWELIREGIEDYEYLWLLRSEAQQLAEAGWEPELVHQANDLLSFNDVATSLTEFNAAAAPLHDHRHRVGQVLEAIANLKNTELKIASIRPAAGGRLVIRFPSVAGRTYRLQSRLPADGSIWGGDLFYPGETSQTAQDTIAGDGEMLSIFVEPRSSESWYRIAF